MNIIEETTFIQAGDTFLDTLLDPFEPFCHLPFPVFHALLNGVPLQQTCTLFVFLKFQCLAVKCIALQVSAQGQSL